MGQFNFGGWHMKVNKLVCIDFKYEDGTMESIIDDRACLLFQSRCNSNGILAGMEDHIVSMKKETEKTLDGQVE